MRNNSKSKQTFGAIYTSIGTQVLHISKNHHPYQLNKPIKTLL